MFTARPSSRSSVQLLCSALLCSARFSILRQRQRQRQHSQQRQLRQWQEPRPRRPCFCWWCHSTLACFAYFGCVFLLCSRLHGARLQFAYSFWPSHWVRLAISRAANCRLSRNLPAILHHSAFPVGDPTSGDRFCVRFRQPLFWPKKNWLEEKTQATAGNFKSDVVNQTNGNCACVIGRLYTERKLNKTPLSVCFHIHKNRWR